MGRGALLVVAVWAVAAVAAAQRRPLPDDLVGADPFSADPIGIDRRSDLHRVPIAEPPGPAEDPAVVAARGPRPPGVEPTAGAVLTAIPGVRELDHAVTLRLADGLVHGVTRLQFRNGARHPAEVRYRLAVPAGAEPVGLTVCVRGKCRAGVADDHGEGLGPYDDAVRARPAQPTEAPLPVAQVARDEAALVLRAAPIAARGGELELSVRWVAPAPVAGGVVRLTLPARGRDPRAASADVRLEAGGLLAPSIDGRPATGAVTADPWVPIEVSARLPTGAATTATAWHFRCGEARCARLRVVAGPRAGRPVDLVVLIDASPSMEGPARGRVGAAVAALLASAPTGSVVRAAAFGARAEAVIDEATPVDAVRLAPFAQAAMRQLGSATRFDAAWTLVAPWVTGGARAGPSPQVVIVGDGGLLAGAESREAFRAARRAGVPVSVLNVADRESWEALTEGALRSGGVVVEAGEAAERAARGRGAEALEEAVARIFAPVVAREVWVGAGGQRLELGALRAGEERVWEGRVGRRAGVAWIAGGARSQAQGVDGALGRALGARAALAAGLEGVSAALVAVDAGDAARRTGDLRCDPLGPPRLTSGVSSDAAPVAPAEPRSCQGQGPVERARETLVPERTVLSMLRQRVVPAARQCFRRDRRGRADHSVRATYELRLADREVIEASVRGDMPEALRACLMGAVHELEVPRFSGTLSVRYPVYTEATPREPTIQLEPEVAGRVDHILR